MTTKKRSIDIVQPKYHPSAKPDEASAALSKDDVMMLLEKSKRSQTVLPDGNVAPRPDGGEQPEGGITPKPSAGRRLLTLVLGTVILVAAVFFGVQAGSRLFDSWADLTPVTTEEGNVDAATANTAAETPATNTAAPAVVEAPVATPAAAPVAAPAVVTVKVLNGNGVPGDATKVKTLLEKAGITVSATGNAKTFGYATTIVYYPTGKKAAADQVVTALTGYSVTATENAVADGYDALVVVGAK
jgi:hypothetical protein